MSKNDDAIIERLNEFYNGTEKNIIELSQNMFYLVIYIWEMVKKLIALPIMKKQ